MADLDQIGEDQLAHSRRLKLQVGAGLVDLILIDQQIDDFFGVVHGIAPATQAGTAEGFDPLRVFLQLSFAGKQNIAVEINAVGVG